MTFDWPLVVGSIAVSVLVVPLVLLSILPSSLTQASGPGILAVGVLAMLPGFLMGATGLWVSARG